MIPAVLNCERIVVPLIVVVPVPLDGLIAILPVEPLPNCNVCLLVVPKTPAPVRKEALLPLLAEMEAVGVPPATLVKAKVALAVAFDPRRRSSHGFLSKIAPFPS